MVTVKEITSKLNYLSVDDDAILNEVFEAVDTDPYEPQVIGVEKGPKRVGSWRS